MIDENFRTEAIAIMDRLISHPAAAYFINEIVPGVDTDPDYYNYVTNPQDLTTIKNRLINKQYTDKYKWYEDVETVWYNAEKYNGTDSYMAVVAREMRRRFEKERKRFCCDSTQLWLSEFNRLRLKCEALVRFSPKKVANNIHEAFLLPIPNTRPINLSDHELHCLKLALEMLKGDVVSKELTRIVRERQPDVDISSTLITLDYGILNTDTLLAIKEYVKNSLEKQGKKYPE